MVVTWSRPCKDIHHLSDGSLCHFFGATCEYFLHGDFFFGVRKHKTNWWTNRRNTAEYSIYSYIITGYIHVHCIVHVVTFRDQIQRSPGSTPSTMLPRKQESAKPYLVAKYDATSARFSWCGEGYERTLPKCEKSIWMSESSTMVIVYVCF